MEAKQVSGVSKKQSPKCKQACFVEVKFSVLDSGTHSLLLVGSVLMV